MEPLRIYLDDRLSSLIMDVSKTYGADKSDVTSILAYLIAARQLPSEAVMNRSLALRDDKEDIVDEVQYSDTSLVKRPPEIKLTTKSDTNKSTATMSENSRAYQPYAPEIPPYEMLLELAEFSGYVEVPTDKIQVVKTHSLTASGMFKITKNRTNTIDVVIQANLGSLTNHGNRGKYEAECLEVLKKKYPDLKFYLNSKLYLSKRRICGTPDALGLKDGKFVIAEFKTSTGKSGGSTYDSGVSNALKQVRFYMLLLGAEIGYVVMRDANGQYEIKTTANTEATLEDFQRSITWFTSQVHYQIC